MRKLLLLIGAILVCCPVWAQTVTVGSPSVVMTNGQAPTCCFPDTNLGVVQISGTYYVFASGFDGGGASNVGVTTNNLDTIWSSASGNIVSSGIPLGNSTAFDRDYVGGGPVYYDSGSGLMIMMYHGEYHYSPPSYTPFISGLGLAVSRDEGTTWTSLGPVILPNITRSNLETCTNNTSLDIGSGGLTVNGSYLYAYFTDVPNSEAGGFCNAYIGVARATISSVVAAAMAGGTVPTNLFMKYSSGSFSTPGVNNSTDANGGGTSSPVINSNLEEPTVAYDSYISQYIMAYTIPGSGLGIAFSTDGISWTNQTTIFSGGTPVGGTNAYQYEALLNTAATGGGNPNILNQSFEMFFVNPYIYNGGWPGTNLNKVLITLGSSGPSVGLSPSSLSFSNQIINTPSSSQNVTLTNTGGGTLTGTIAMGTGTQFSITGGSCDTGGFSLSGSSSCSVDVQFEPTSTGAQTDNVVFTTNAGTHDVPTSGTGTSSSSSTYYIDWVGGSDSNDGLSKVSPWKHAPGMTGVAGTPAGHTITAGDSYIFKGGVTWPAAAFPWQLVFTGSSSSTSPVGCAGSGCIYVGVDQTWYTGSSWTRPISNGGDTQVGVYPGGIQSVIDLYGNYFILDNIEFTGWWQTVNTSGTWSIIAIRSGQTEIKNNYIHGWGHSGSATQDNARFISSGASCPPDMTSSIHNNVVDGADTTMDIGFGMGVAQGYVYDNYVADLPTLMFGTARYWFGNSLWNSGPGAFDPGTHGNVIESAGCQMIAFNNYSNGAYLGSSFFHTPVDGSIDYDFNNVLVNQDGVQAVQVDGNGLSTGAGAGIYIFNDTLQEGAAQGGNPISLSSRGATLPFATIYNNHTIATNPSVNVGDATAVVTQANNVERTNAQAASDGYSVSTTYPYTPPNGTAITVGAGKPASTMDPICSGIPSTSVDITSTACLSDSAVGVGYNTSNHTVIVPNRNSVIRPTSGDWDAGAYQFSGSAPTIPPVPRVSGSFY